MVASRPKILSDVIINFINKQDDMLIVGDIIDPIHLLYTTKETATDVIILSPLQENGEPKICKHLLAEQAHLKIIVIHAKGKSAWLYQSGLERTLISNPTEHTIINTIRESQKKNKE